MAIQIDTGSVLQIGWDIVKKHWKFLIPIEIVTFIILQIIPASITEALGWSETIWSFPVSLLLMVVNLIVTAGWMKLFLELLNQKQPRLEVFFEQTQLLGDVLVGSLVYGLYVFLGFLLLVIPGIVLAIKYQFYLPLIIDKGMKPMEALRKSAQMTQGHKWQLFWLGIMFGLVNLGGTILLFIGLLITMPMTGVAQMHVYKQLVTESKEKSIA